MKHLFYYSDRDYRDAINYDGTNFYNFPVTVNIGSDKYVLSVGSSDSLYSSFNDGLLTIIGENTGLDYISCTVIDTVNKEVLQEVYLDNVSSMGLTQYLFDLDMDGQVEILSEYFQ